MAYQALNNICIVIAVSLSLICCTKPTTSHNIPNELTIMSLVCHHLKTNDQAEPCDNPIITGCTIDHETLLGLIIYHYRIQGRKKDVVVLQNSRTNACYVVDFDDYVTQGTDETDDMMALSEFICQAHISYQLNAPSFDQIVEATLPSNYYRYVVPRCSVPTCEGVKKGVPLCTLQCPDVEE